MSKPKEPKPTEWNKISQSGRAEQSRAEHSKTDQTRTEQSRAELMEIHYPVAKETNSGRPYTHLQHFHGMIAGSCPAI